MKIGLTGIIGGQQLTGDASGLGADESALFASMLETTPAMSAAKPAWMNRKPDSYNTVATETSETGLSPAEANPNEDVLAGVFAPLNMKADGHLTSTPEIAHPAHGVTLNDGGQSGRPESGFEAGLDRLNANGAAAQTATTPVNADTGMQGMSGTTQAGTAIIAGETAAGTKSGQERSFSETLTQSVSGDAMTAASAQTRVNANPTAAVGAVVHPVSGKTMASSAPTREGAINMSAETPSSAGVINTEAGAQVPPQTVNASTAQTPSAQPATIQTVIGAAVQPVLGNVVKQAGLAGERVAESGKSSVAEIATGAKTPSSAGAINSETGAQAPPQTVNASTTQTPSAQPATIQTVIGAAVQPVLGNVVRQAGLAGERVAESGKSSVAEIATGAKTPSSSGVINTETGAQTASQTVNAPNGQMATAQPAANPAADLAAKPAPQMPDMTLLPEADDGFELLDAETATLDDGLQIQTHRTDARVVEAAAQNALRGSSAPQMAALVSRIGEQFLERFTGKTSTFEIRLDPPELGKVDIRVEVGTDGKVMAVLAARDPSVADALMRGAKTLENALTQAGLNLSEGGVQVELDQNKNSAFANQDSDDVAEDYQGMNSPAGEDLAEAGEDAPLTPVIETWSRRRLDLTA
jgi:flagellar hook-length control protein FliK